MRRALLPPALVLAAACASAPGAAEAQGSPAPAPAPALALAPMAGQNVPVLPVTLLVADAPTDEFLPADRVARLAWADSVVGETLVERGPEVTWVLPEALRRVARRAPGTVTDPDRMGQALLRAEQMDRVPDPLRSHLRGLSAMTDARLILVPAAIRLQPDSTGGVRAELVLVLTDTRNGGIVWRSRPVATGPNAREALRAAVIQILPSLD
jgi:hypothetical protein